MRRDDLHQMAYLKYENIIILYLNITILPMSYFMYMKTKSAQSFLVIIKNILFGQDK